MNHVDFDTKSDRELLLLVAQQTNDITDTCAGINETLVIHGERITTLEATKGSPIRGMNWQALTVIGIVLAVALSEFGSRFGWW